MRVQKNLKDMVEKEGLCQMGWFPSEVEFLKKSLVVQLSDLRSGVIIVVCKLLVETHVP